MTLTDSSDIDERVAAKSALEETEQRLQTICASHAATFVAVEQRTASLLQSLKSLLENIDKLSPLVQDAVSNVQPNKTDNSAYRLGALAEKHKVRRRTLLQHSALLELLELPSLMDACIRSNLYEEALSVAGLANSLEQRHLVQGVGPAKVVGNVVNEVRVKEGELRRQLVQRLRGEMTMPQCLEVVTALRRLNNVELERKTVGGEELERLHAAAELRLQVDFFEARDAWLDCPPAMTQEHLLDVVDRYRTRCFEIATQFLAIFKVDESKLTSDLSLLSLWVTRRLHIFLSSLPHHLAGIQHTADLRDALDATLFFSTSMARIGADFQPLLPPIFQPRLLAIVTRHWEDGLTSFHKTLTLCQQNAIAYPLYSPSAETPHENPSTETPSPPKLLLAYPPLARLVNAYLTGLNDLRRCLLPGIFQQLKKESISFSEKIKQLLQANQRTVLTPGMKGDAPQLRKIAADMIGIFEGTLVDYFEEALGVALGLVPYPPPEEHVEDTPEDDQEEQPESEDAAQDEPQTAEQIFSEEQDDTVQPPLDDAEVLSEEEGEAPN